jgi:hypothetical protein
MATLNENASITKRPDAISFSYLTAFSFGPVRQADESLGALDRVWRIRTTGNDVYLARANDANDAYVEEVLLFSFAGVAAIEIDVAFDQQANVVVAVERPTGAGGSSEIWVYFFDSSVAQYVFTNFGAGRTPRAILDDPFEPTANDVLIFYMDDVGNQIVYRQQRDRYAVIYPIPATTATNTYLEDAYKAQDGRIHIVYSVHDPVLGQYLLYHRESGLYPYFAEEDSFTTQLAALDGELLHLVLIVYPTGFVDPDGLASDALLEVGMFQAAGVDALPGGDLHSIFILQALYDVDSFQAAGMTPLPGGLLVAPVILRTLYDVDTFQAVSMTPLAGGTLVVIVITKTLYDIDSFQATSITPLAGGTLV